MMTSCLEMCYLSDWSPYLAFNIINLFYLKVWFSPMKVSQSKQESHFLGEIPSPDEFKYQSKRTKQVLRLSLNKDLDPLIELKQWIYAVFLLFKNDLFFFDQLMKRLKNTPIRVLKLEEQRNQNQKGLRKEDDGEGKRRKVNEKLYETEENIRLILNYFQVEREEMDLYLQKWESDRLKEGEESNPESIYLEHIPSLYKDPKMMKSRSSMDFIEKLNLQDLIKNTGLYQSLTEIMIEMYFRHSYDIEDRIPFSQFLLTLCRKHMCEVVIHEGHSSTFFSIVPDNFDLKRHQFIIEHFKKSRQDQQIYYFIYLKNQKLAIEDRDSFHQKMMSIPSPANSPANCPPSPPMIRKVSSKQPQESSTLMKSISDIFKPEMTISVKSKTSTNDSSKKSLSASLNINEEDKEKLKEPTLMWSKEKKRIYFK